MVVIVPLCLCSFCGRSDFSSKKVFNEHIEKYKDLELPCEKCDLKFSTKRALYLHVNGVHKEKHQCDQCVRYFSTKTNLEIHKKYNHMEKEAICKICNLNFKNNLTRHMQSCKEKIVIKECKDEVKLNGTKCDIAKKCTDAFCTSIPTISS